ncbi:hypothetical protein NA57DRAFT_76685 [Rhizodiscina lignyota]|uniref:Uncharacterized protein n=1 Tax=Rhizodiscina lignyota TaxID=1504668 RepID=A0A9P4M5I8_9PEZI|nr:hypothetical protein NA57DRAFT_76685 [Rhizodiscina lignyota]
MPRDSRTRQKSERRLAFPRPKEPRPFEDQERSWKRAKKDTLDLSALRNRAAEPHQNRFNALSWRDTSPASSNWAFSPATPSRPRQSASNRTSWLKNPIPFEQLDQLFSHTSTYRDSNAAGGEQDVSFIGSSEALFKSISPPTCEKHQSLSPHSDAYRTENPNKPAACFFPMTTYFPSHGFSEEFLNRPRTISSDFKRKHSKFFPPTSLLTSEEAGTSTQVITVNPTIPDALDAPAASPVVNLPLQSSKTATVENGEDNDEALRPEQLIYHSGCCEKADMTESSEQEEDAEFEDVDTEADEEDWTILFPDTTVVKVFICAKDATGQPPNAESHWSCRRCGWYPAWMEKKNQ